MLENIKRILSKKLNRSIDKTDIDMNQLEKMVSKGAVLVDVRSPQEYKEGHIRGAILIPEYELLSKIKRELPDKDKTIIVYCASGARSKKAQEQLKKIGYYNVYNLYNGIQNYWDFKSYVIEYQIWKKENYKKTINNV